MATAGPAPGAGIEAAGGPTPAALWAIAVAACAAAAITLALALTSDHVSEPGVLAALLSWITLAYVFAGLIAWSRRPGSHFGPLMVAAGFANFLTNLSWANVAVPFTIGIAFDLLPPVLFLHVFLAFPSGRLEGRLERGLVTAAYAIGVGLQLVGMMLGGFGPDNLLALTTQPDAAFSLLRGQLVALGAFCLAGLGILVARRRGDGRPLRRSLALLVDAFALGLVMIAFLFLSVAFGLLDPEGGSAFEMIRWVAYFIIGLAPVAFLIGLLSARLAHSAVGDLLVELRSDPAPAALRDALARALRDPSLRLVYWLGEFESWADVDGKPVELPAADGGRSTTLIERDGSHVAALVHDPSLDDEPDLLQAVAAAAAIALENARLQVELRARVDELRGSRARLVEAGDAERRRLERNLHDGAQQRMVSVALQLRLAQGRIGPDPAVAEQLLTTASEELALSLSELRELARGIHPAVLEHGLAAALESLATRATVPTTLRGARAPARAGRVRRVLRRLRGAGQRLQVRPRDVGDDARAARRADREHRDRR